MSCEYLPSVVEKLLYHFKIRLTKSAETTGMKGLGNALRALWTYNSF